MHPACACRVTSGMKVKGQRMVFGHLWCPVSSVHSLLSSVALGLPVGHRSPSYLPQQFEHVGRLIYPAITQQLLDLFDPRHSPDVRAVVGPAQHPGQFVRFEHQCEQKVPAAPFALRRAVDQLASLFGEILIVQAALAAQSGAHVAVVGVEETAAAQTMADGGSRLSADTRQVPAAGGGCDLWSNDEDASSSSSSDDPLLYAAVWV